MTGTPEPLVARARKVVRRALGSRPVPPRGGILVYCAGCLAASPERAGEIATEFGAELRGAPFVGVATFGEQGAVAGSASTNHHGNLMCTAALFQ